ncbi:unnamed protein product [Spirodela intermedia]|uniref:tRNA-uridine aminocarboxypropyltransferase n=1 Tax=Spirodela intermedia TaxID=51605 RepID=A0A7I8KS80_SPIIN|nr:unnamed protein product [Spirodela intermedia]
METAAAAAAAAGEVEEEEEEEEEAEEEAALTSTRPVCREGCGRPLKVCLCRHLPEAPIPTATAVVVLQHPHELRRRLSTSPLLPRCLLRCSLLPGRRLLPGSHPLLDSLHRAATAVGRVPDPPAALFLFPSATTGGEEEEEELLVQRYRGRCRALIVFDGTWKHAGEMVRASLPFLSCFARRVSLAGGCNRSSEGESMFESELALRKEPHRGCLTTVEAVARALAALEPHDGGEGPRAESALLSALRAMVALQMAHLSGKTVNRRPRLLKKKKKNNNKETEEEDPGPFSTPAVCSTK